MPLFGQKGHDEAGADATPPPDAPAAPPAVEAGDVELPGFIGERERLAQLRDKDGRFFTSRDSLDSLLLFDDLGLEPVGSVLGATMYHIGWVKQTWRDSREVPELTQMMYNARELMMSRLLDEGRELRADGIIDIRVNIYYWDWGPELAEFVATGTAVRYRDPARRRAPDAPPFTTEYDGRGVWRLRRLGFAPLAFVMGNCVWHVAHQSLRATLNRVGRNVEMPNFTQALYSARELAMVRMQEEAQGLGGDGITTHSLSDAKRGWGDHVMEFTAFGNTVKRIPGERPPLSPSLIFDVSS
jgi:uncharacterized protein YbjQ (UPF0145 family)